MLVLFGRIPAERMLFGPLGFRDARTGSTGRHAATTVVQLVVFWGLFLVVFPLVIAGFEQRWGLRVPMPSTVVVIGGVVFVLASALGLWSALAMSTRGDGTPLPSAATTRLVTSGPYRFVRNPMAVAGIVQGATVGLVLQSWLVVVYAMPDRSCGTGSSVPWKRPISSRSSETSTALTAHECGAGFPDSEGVEPREGNCRADRI